MDRRLGDRSIDRVERAHRIESRAVRLVDNTHIEVFDGCAHTSGSVEIRPRSFTVGGLVGTAPAGCATRRAVSFGRVLPGTVRFEIDADRLTLTNADGSGFAFHAKTG